MAGNFANGVTRFRCDTCQREWGEIRSPRQNATTPSPDSSGQHPAHHDLATNLRSSCEFDVLGRPPYPNALVVGLPNVVRAAMTALLPYLPQPVSQYDGGVSSRSFVTARDTLVLWNVDLLDNVEQRRLFDVIEDHRRLVIMSVTPSGLFERVQRGEFIEALYYRLNTVRVHAETLLRQITDAHSWHHVTEPTLNWAPSVQSPVGTRSRPLPGSRIQ
jgi:hypothetical protein